MITTIHQNLAADNDTRKNLIKLKQMIKEKSSADAFLKELDSDYTLLKDLLKHTDPKVRKNTALIIGELNLDELIEELVNAYQQEETLFVRNSYLKALKKLPCEPYLETLKNNLDQLLKRETLEEEQKHISAEVRELTEIINQYEKGHTHYFVGFDEPAKVVLTTNRLHADVTYDQLKDLNVKRASGGVVLSYEEMSEFLDIRTYSEALYPLPSAKNLAYDANEIAHAILMSGVLKFLEARHLGADPYRFRLEIRSRMDVDYKRELVKKAAASIEKKSKYQLINSTSQYEIELRLMENKNGTLNAYLKLYTIPDKRFSYRKNILPNSIHPVTAATIMELAKPYLKEDAQVLDPFCGTGTMLIERNYAMPAHPIYGVDVYGVAAEYAKENARAAHAGVNIVNKSFEDFTHEYEFDEIVTNMPSVMGKQTEYEIDQIYEMFFEKAEEHLKDQGIIILYSADPMIAMRHINACRNIELLKKYQIYQKDGSYLYILRLSK